MDQHLADLIEFVDARIKEDEATARDAIRFTDAHDDEDEDRGDRWTLAADGAIWTGQVVVAHAGSWMVSAEGIGEHIARLDPARVLAECEAKRQIVEHARLWNAPQEHVLARGRVRTDAFALGVRDGAAVALLVLARVYAEHPDFRDGWRA